MTALEQHLSGLLHNSSNSSDSTILICDNAKGSSFSDSNKGCRKPPTSDSLRHNRTTKKRRLETPHFEAESRWESNEEQLSEKSPSCPLRIPSSHRKATISARHNRRTKKRRLETPHFEAESRWESNEEQLSEKSPSCPLRSPSSHRKATISARIPASYPRMALPDECLFMSPGKEMNWPSIA
jgi:hypothetical protein